MDSYLGYVTSVLEYASSVDHPTALYEAKACFESGQPVFNKAQEAEAESAAAARRGRLTQSHIESLYRSVLGVMRFMKRCAEYDYLSN
jgi:hypothetical protein